MNDTQISALIGLAGSLVGALAALGGTWLTLWHTRKEAKMERVETRLDLHVSIIRDAYLEWLTAINNAAVRLPDLIAAVDNDDNKLGAEFLEKLQADPVFSGNKLMLLDPDKKSLELIEATVKEYFRHARTIIERKADQNEVARAFGTQLGMTTSHLRKRLVLSLPNRESSTPKRPSHRA